jgi:tetratricopeptide (TPR) repeat protein
MNASKIRCSFFEMPIDVVPSLRGRSQCLVGFYPCFLIVHAIVLGISVATPACVLGIDEPKKSSVASDSLSDTGLDKVERGGQSDLDQAIVLRIDADDTKELQKVISLLETALKKGLSDENALFAKKMIGSIQLEQAQRIVAELNQGGGLKARSLRTDALKSLRSATTNDPDLVEAFLLIARLNLLPEGNLEEARQSCSTAVDLLRGDPRAQSEAYFVRSLSQIDEENRKADLNKSISLDPSNPEARQARAVHSLRNGQAEDAIEDLRFIIQKMPNNQAVIQMAIEQLVTLGKTEAAIKLLGEAIEANPSEGFFRLRGLIRRANGDDVEAAKDFSKAIELQPKDPISLLQRAEIALAKGDLKGAKNDFDDAIRVESRVSESLAAMRVRCYIAVEEGRLADAINDMTLIAKANPEDAFWSLQLASLFVQDKRPSNAVRILSEVLLREPKNIAALRSRADTLLGMGRHSEAIKDYEQALQFGIANPSLKSGVLNNLAWVLATSPDDSLRNGKRSIELATEAASLSDYKEPYILSTLAAAYAEAGDFEAAIEWSKKAIDLGRRGEHDNVKQLEQELNSFEKKEPLREKQESLENKAPLLPSEDLIDT